MDEVKNSAAESAEQKAQIRVDASQADSSYANFVLVATSPEEVVLSFGLRAGDEPSARVQDRIILSPKNAKRFLAALMQSIRTYEEKFGVIDTAIPSLREKGGK